MEGSIRRSNRRRAPNKKYPDSMREHEISRTQREYYESSGLSPARSAGSATNGGDDDFNADEVGEDEFLAEGSETALAKPASELTARDSSTVLAIDKVNPEEPKKHQKKAQFSLAAASLNNAMHSRGLQSTHIASAKDHVWSSLAGPDRKDIFAILTQRNQWRLARDATFPSRSSLANIAKDGQLFALSNLGIEFDDLKHENTVGWNWYNEPAGLRFRVNQCMCNMDREKITSHLDPATGQEVKLVMGPTSNQQIYSLEHLDSMDFGAAWNIPSSSQHGDDFGSSHSEAGNRTSHGQSRYREGWLVNLGSKIQCLAWAPNLCKSKVQYLALSVACSSAQRDSVLPVEDRRAAAFRSSPAYPSAIQIWALQFEHSDTDGLQRIDMKVKPVLRTVLCTRWGDIRQLQWCPVLRDLEGEGNGESDDGRRYLGLLGVLASDGHIRVLDISVPQLWWADPDHRQLNTAAFDEVSSTSLYTCFSFLSSTDLVCGTADGTLNLLSIVPSDVDAARQHQNHPPSQSNPYLTTQQSPTYIQSVLPTYPSPFPALIASMSMTGCPVLTDLRAPLVDRTIGKSARLGTKLLVYSPQLRCYISTTDGDDLYAYPTRRFFNGIRIGRYAEQGVITALAMSPWHPCLMMGTAGGTVSCSNVLRRIIPSAKRSGGKETWVQKLCEYHWRPETHLQLLPEATSSMTTSKFDAISGSNFHFYGRDTRRGISRFYDGFMPQLQPPIGTSASANKIATKDPSSTPKSETKSKPRSQPQTESQGNAADSKTAKRSSSPLPFTAKPSVGNGNFRLNNATRGTETVYEEEQAVNCLAWNPNLSCAGVVAIGWNSGLLRIEDVAVDGI